MKKKISIVNIITFFIIIIVSMLIVSDFHVVQADELSGQIFGNGASSIANAAGKIVGAIKWAGVAILIGAIIVKGIKFVSAAPDGQAKIKEEIILLVIGAFLLFSITSILQLLEKVAEKI